VVESCARVFEECVCACDHEGMLVMGCGGHRFFISKGRGASGHKQDDGEK
jgi:hypothetical protein